jgi:ubiquinone biosynthesis protein UbiJ
MPGFSVPRAALSAVVAGLAGHHPSLPVKLMHSAQVGHVEAGVQPSHTLPRSMLPMLPTFPLLPPDRVIVRALNALLAREPWAAERLTRHAGKTVRFSIAGFKLNLAIASDGGVATADAAIVPDVVLTLRAEDFAPLQWAARRRASPDAGVENAVTDVMHIEGDAGLAQVIGELARNLRWDPEDELAGVVGDVAAARLAGGARASFEGVRKLGARLAANVTEYLSEERGVITSAPLLADMRLQNSRLAADVKALDTRVAGLAARLARSGANRSPSR